jgi:hypothetical protein
MLTNYQAFVSMHLNHFVGDLMFCEKKPKTVLLSLRIDEDLDDKIHKVVLGYSSKRAIVVRHCLEKGLDNEIKEGNLNGKSKH